MEQNKFVNLIKNLIDPIEEIRNKAIQSIVLKIENEIISLN